MQQLETARHRQVVRFLAAAISLTALVLVGLGWDAVRTYREVGQLGSTNVRIAELRGLIMQYDEVLTMSARMAAATGDLSWETRYRRFEPLLDAAIKESQQLAPARAALAAAAQTDLANQRLIALENTAFEFVRAGRREEASNVLFSAEYESQKQIYADGMALMGQDLMARIQRNLAAQRRRVILHICGVAIGLALLLTGWLLLLRAIHRWQHALITSHNDLMQTTKDLAALNTSLDAKVQERTVAIERSNKELEQFAYIASHDLQEPLRKITSYCQLLQERYRGQLDETALRYMHYVIDGAQRMQTLIRDLLTYSRLHTRGKPFAPVDCNAVAAAAQGNLETAIASSGAQIRCGTLPTIEGDATQLTQVFQNLIGNAIKYRRAEAPPEVTIDAAQQNGTVEFTVRDNGIGIDPKFYDRIFVIFQRLHSREEYEGTGIGLAVCQKVVERHGGKIWVDSHPGEGSTFHFTLPAQPGGNDVRASH